MDNLHDMPDGLTEKEWRYVLNAYGKTEREPGCSDEALEALIDAAVEDGQALDEGVERTENEEWESFKLFGNLFNELTSRVHNEDYEPIKPRIVQFFTVYRYCQRLCEKLGYEITEPRFLPKAGQGCFDIIADELRLSGGDLRDFCDMMQEIDDIDTDIHLDGRVHMNCCKFHIFKRRS